MMVVSSKRWTALVLIILELVHENRQLEVDLTLKQQFYGMPSHQAARLRFRTFTNKIHWRLSANQRYPSFGVLQRYFWVNEDSYIAFLPNSICLIIGKQRGTSDADVKLRRQLGLDTSCIQLFRQRLSKNVKAYARMPKVSLGNT